MEYWRRVRAKVDYLVGWGLGACILVLFLAWALTLVTPLILLIATISSVAGLAGGSYTSRRIIRWLDQRYEIWIYREL